MKNMDIHKCFVHKHRDSDWHRGDGNIVPRKFGAISSGSWTPYVHYFEWQKFTFDCEGCIIFAAQEDIDADLDYQIQMGLIPQSTIDLWTRMGFMDSVNSLDGKPHFHSSMLFTFRNTGNGFNGNSLQDPLDADKKFGIVPWLLLPFDQNTTQSDCLAPNSQALLDIGQQFLLSAGGKNWLQYHWINEGGPTDMQAMDEARQQAPLMIAVSAITPDWNQYAPPPNGDAPDHGVMNYDSDGQAGELILDHYVPFEKDIKKGWNINYVIQAIINIVPPSPVPTLPPNPTIPQEMTWLAQLQAWLQNLYEQMFDGERLCGGARSPKWPEVRKAFLQKYPACAACGQTNKHKLAVHHRMPFHLDKSKELLESNLVTLCGKGPVNCHYLFGHCDLSWKCYNPMVETDVGFTTKVREGALK